MYFQVIPTMATVAGMGTSIEPNPTATAPTSGPGRLRPITDLAACSWSLCSGFRSPARPR